MRVIRRIARHIAENFDPEQIILFGSHAYGSPRPWSDVDLLVIMDAPKGEIETGIEIRRMLPILPFGLDILVRTEQSIKKRIEMGDFFIKEILSRGKRLYARPDPRVGE